MVDLEKIAEAQKTRQAYLDMLDTKLFANEYYKNLSLGSRKKVEVVCPFCGSQRSRAFLNINTTGNSLCQRCSKTIGSYAFLVGTKVGKLLILSFGDYKKGGDSHYSAFNVLCECGVEKVIACNSIAKHYTLSCGCYNREVLRSKAGPLSHLWNPNLTEEERRKNRDGRQASWSIAVRKRDNYTCQVCGSAENLVAHHLNSYKDNKENRFDLENGVTLCRDCHADFHCNFMGNYKTLCTAEDFDEYLIQV